MYGSVTILDLIVVVTILFVAVMFSKTIAIYIRRSFKERISKDVSENMIKLFSYAIIGLAVLTVLPMLDLNPSGLLVAGGILAIVIGFASQSIVGNLISGIFLMLERPVKIGDLVGIDGVTGYVEEINMVSTTLRTLNGVFVRIPNETVFTTHIENFWAHPARRFKYIIGIRYNDDADQAEKIIRKILDDYPLVLKNPRSDVFVDNLGDNAMNIYAKIWTPSTEWWEVKKVLLWKMKKALEEEGIEIAFPQRTLWFANELESKSPPNWKIRDFD